MLVLACNTATSATIDDLRKTYHFPIIGMEPAIKPAIQYSKKRILVLATTFTLNSQRLYKLIQRINNRNNIDKLPLDKLVLYAENFNFNSNKVVNYIKKSFNMINIYDYDVIVLGCTHFIFYKNIIQEIIPKNIQLIDGNLGTANNIYNTLQENKLLNNNIKNTNNVIFYSSNILCNKSRSNKMLYALSII